MTLSNKKLSHDWTGPNRVSVYVHCKNCLKIFEVLKAKGACPGTPHLKLVTKCLSQPGRDQHG